MKLIRETIYKNIGKLIKVFSTLLLISDIVTSSFIDIRLSIEFKCLLRLTFEEDEINDNHDSPRDRIGCK